MPEGHGKPKAGVVTPRTLGKGAGVTHSRGNVAPGRPFLTGGQKCIMEGTRTLTHAAGSPVSVYVPARPEVITPSGAAGLRAAGQDKDIC
ncbi:hypothetical protein E2C01_049527 [Portunus trituberculatus]|uniref:Uncharacterized protein n=1 Tax=Portunus trituberculatus TaxID=210409 RepID=A0A5B7GDY8_PORTR|nr:hypothetical protein [Portunus trituberculatus]